MVLKRDFTVYKFKPIGTEHMVKRWLHGWSRTSTMYTSTRIMPNGLCNILLFILGNKKNSDSWFYLKIVTPDSMVV